MRVTYTWNCSNVVEISAVTSSLAQTSQKICKLLSIEYHIFSIQSKFSITFLSFFISIDSWQWSLAKACSIMTHNFKVILYQSLGYQTVKRLKNAAALAKEKIDKIDENKQIEMPTEAELAADVKLAGQLEEEKAKSIQTNHKPEAWWKRMIDKWFGDSVPYKNSDVEKQARATSDYFSKEVVLNLNKRPKTEY